MELFNVLLLNIRTVSTYIMTTHGMQDQNIAEKHGQCHGHGKNDGALFIGTVTRDKALDKGGMVG
jgi:hypothetical protein